jgi:flavin reductase (DIM6/NTAB) family NADH-FMN oxidoreductase RutF
LGSTLRNERIYRDENLPLSKVYQLLEPGPVVLLTTAQKGRANVMTMSWHMMVEFEPPLVACVVSGANYSFAALRATKECVIAVPAVELAPKVVRSATARAGTCGSSRNSASLRRQPSAWRRLWW